MRVLGLDTSNYTTSAAVFDGITGRNIGKLLEVPEGSLGLRQNEALFQHVRRMPEIVGRLREAGILGDISAVCASTRPRAVEGSYMPCFLAGESFAKVLAQVLGVPYFSCSHQQGHIAAAAWSSGRPKLMDSPHLAWHLSGGTTELLLVGPDGRNVKAERVGGTTDLSAGQLVDRAGKLLGLPFPAGKALDALAARSDQATSFRVKLKDLSFSFSGVENQIFRLAECGESPENVARFTLETIAGAVRGVTDRALLKWPDLPVLCSGGVASNSLLRAKMKDAVFAPPEYSTDNALGVAILGLRMLEGG